MNKKRILAVVAVAAALGFYKFGPKKEDKPQFREARVERGELHRTVLATGVAQPQNRVEIKPPIAGRAEDIRVKEGDEVKKGQVLAWMSSVERAALLDAARAKGPEELAHWEELYKPTPLIAPLSGVIISRLVEPGQTVSASDAVLVMSNRLIVKAQVDETDIGQIRRGQEAEITLDAYSQEKIPAKVDHIAYEAKTVNNVTIYEVDVLPGRVPDFMRSGMTANVTFMVASKENVLLLPAEAVRNEGGKSSVMIKNANGKKRPDSKEIETGITDGKNIEVLSGLNEGDRVLVRSFRLPRSSSGSSPFSPLGNQRRNGQGGNSGRRQ